jgi:hypothetical protein
VSDLASCASTTTGGGGAVDQGGKQAVKMTRLSCHRFRFDEVQLTLRLRGQRMLVKFVSKWLYCGTAVCTLRERGK